MSHKSRFLEVEHEAIVKEEPPFFLGGVLHLSVKVRNLEPRPVTKRFCYILVFPGGTIRRKMEYDLGPNEEKEYPLQPPYYLQFMGNFRIVLLGGVAGRKLDEEDIDDIYKLPISPNDVLYALFVGNVRDEDSYTLQARTVDAVEMMSKSTDAIKESNNQIRKTSIITLSLTIAIVFLAVAEILTLVIG